MAGRKGQRQTPRRDTARQKMWNSMRIMRRFTIADLCRTAGATYDNARKYVRFLARHAVIASVHQRARGVTGSVGLYHLAKDLGPYHPVICPVCDRPVCGPCEKEAEHE